MFSRGPGRALGPWQNAWQCPRDPDNFVGGEVSRDCRAQGEGRRRPKGLGRITFSLGLVGRAYLHSSSIPNYPNQGRAGEGLSTNLPTEFQVGFSL